MSVTLLLHQVKLIEFTNMISLVLDVDQIAHNVIEQFELRKNALIGGSSLDSHLMAA